MDTPVLSAQTSGRYPPMPIDQLTFGWITGPYFQSRTFTLTTLVLWGSAGTGPILRGVATHTPTGAPGRPSTPFSCHYKEIKEKSFFTRYKKESIRYLLLFQLQHKTHLDQLKETQTWKFQMLKSEKLWRSSTPNLHSLVHSWSRQARYRCKCWEREAVGQHTHSTSWNCHGNTFSKSACTKSFNFLYCTFQERVALQTILSAGNEWWARHSFLSNKNIA